MCTDTFVELNSPLWQR